MSGVDIPFWGQRHIEQKFNMAFFLFYCNLHYISTI